eukprot:9651357-Lingulodinium_polyedra.AAC.1
MKRPFFMISFTHWVPVELGSSKEMYALSPDQWSRMGFSRALTSPVAVATTMLAKPSAEGTKWRPYWQSGTAML